MIQYNINQYTVIVSSQKWREVGRKREKQKEKNAETQLKKSNQGGKQQIWKLPPNCFAAPRGSIHHNQLPTWRGCTKMSSWKAKSLQISSPQKSSKSDLFISLERRMVSVSFAAWYKIGNISLAKWISWKLQQALAKQPTNKYKNDSFPKISKDHLQPYPYSSHSIWFQTWDPFAKGHILIR